MITQNQLNKLNNDELIKLINLIKKELKKRAVKRICKCEIELNKLKEEFKKLKNEKTK